MNKNWNINWKAICRNKLEIELSRSEKILRGYFIEPDFRIIWVKRARRICAALERIEAGTYGQCIRCDQEINYKRLLAYPYYELCMHCQTKRKNLRTPLQYITSMSRGVQ
jgi:hypothetical protein